MDPRRRHFLRGSLSNPATPVALPQRPPWALTETAFTERCTRCDACARACPRSLIHAGDGGFPVISFADQGCDFCTQCLKTCPSGALSANAQPPFAARVHIADTCLNRQQVECRICGDACDTRALQFAPAPGGISSLAVMHERCTGCGECLGPCPVGAITMKRI